MRNIFKILLNFKYIEYYILKKKKKNELSMMFSDLIQFIWSDEKLFVIKET